MINKAKQNYIDFAWSLFDILNKQQGEDKEDIDYDKAPDELTLPETIIALPRSLPIPIAKPATKWEKYIMEKGSSVIMDEIGFLEEKATLFHEAILLRLNSSLPVIAAVREGTETPFLSKIKNYPNIRVISLSPENREQVFLELLPIVRNW